MTSSPSSTDPAGWITRVISEYIRTSPENSLNNAEKDRAWADPLVGFSSGADPLYQEFCDQVGDGYLHPVEIMRQAYPAMDRKAEDLTIISWILPQTDRTIRDNARETRLPAESWARSRVYGELFNQNVRNFLTGTLLQQGYQAIAPVSSPLWKVTSFEDTMVSSNWSERHAAYASGLGTFGLCDGLITPRGKAMRCGSVITSLHVPATHRAYRSRTEYCSYLTDGSCGVCMKRCPAGAISPSGHDKGKCAVYLDKMTYPHIKTFGFEGYACGLCQTHVPCESHIPKRRTHPSAGNE